MGRDDAAIYSLGSLELKGTHASKRVPVRLGILSDVILVNWTMNSLTLSVSKSCISHELGICSSAWQLDYSIWARLPDSEISANTIP
jgi:hypothetical protein